MLPNLYCIDKNILAHYGLRNKMLAHNRLENNILALKVRENRILDSLKNPAPPPLEV